MKPTKISKPTQKIIKNAIDVATTLGIESLVWDSFSLRGENQELSISIIMPTKDIDSEFDALGMSRIALLKNRMQLMENADVSFETFDKGDDQTIVSNLKFTQGKSTVSFRCADPNHIKAPKAINDPIHYELTLNEKDVEFIVKGITTMNSEVINLSVTDGKLVIKISDKEGDMFSHETEGDVELADDASETVSKTYKSKTLRTIFTNYIKKDDNSILPISITRRGVMRISVLGMWIYMFPER